MNGSVYTLLIVESPVLGKIIQELCPPSVYVIATGGYCWRPVYDFAKNELKAKADPDKIDIRRELKEQAQWANSVVIATDPDPSGDFIAWSVAKFLKTSVIRRALLQNLSKNGIINMLSDIREIDSGLLESRLKNLFLIQNEWSANKNLPEKELSGLVSVFCTSGNYSHFLDEKGRLYKSPSLVQCEPDEWISVKRSVNNHHFESVEPLSTFDLLEKIVSHGITDKYHEAQVLLQRLFQTVLLQSNESLISYPRTAANSFYSETWENIRHQNMKISSANELKPIFLQEIASPDLPHESINPLNLSLKPDQISGELPKNIGDLYKLIYSHTIRSIRMPKPLPVSLVDELNPDVYFYPLNQNEEIGSIHSLRPCITVADLGASLYRMGISKASNFGERMDAWIAGQRIRVRQNVVTAMPRVTKLGNYAAQLKRKLVDLKNLEDRISLTPETVQKLLSS